LADRTKLLVHIRRISSLFENAMRNGPDGTLEGKFRHEHPTFINHSVGFYLIGCLAYLEGEDGIYSWNRPSLANSDFDAFANSYPPPPKESFKCVVLKTHSKKYPRYRSLSQSSRSFFLFFNVLGSLIS